MGDVAELLIASSWGQINNSDYDSTWASNKPSGSKLRVPSTGDRRERIWDLKRR